MICPELIGKAVGRIILYGLRVGYFPLSLSPTFMISTIFGETRVSDEALLDSFKLFVSTDEKEVVTSMLQDFKENDEDLMDLLSAYKCYRNPNAGNIREILVELSHQELIQKPRYISNCFARVFRNYNLPVEFRSVEGLKEFYTKRIPSSKKIIKVLTCEPSNDQERCIFDHLTRYLKSLNSADLQKFLQFVTGGDIMPIDNITVTFSSEQQPRAPRARTCVPLLEISDTYISYTELAKEISHVINTRDSFIFSFI